MINVRVHDIDAHYRRVVEAGALVPIPLADALVPMPLEDAFYGFRRFELNDPQGNRWHVYGSFAQISARGEQLDGDS